MLNINFDNTYARNLEGMYLPVQGAPAPDPQLVWLNEDLAAELGLDPDALKSSEGLQMLAGSTMPAGAASLAMAYAGHQFGGFSPQLGDGRAMLVGEVMNTQGARRDIHLKGSGRTPFSRGGDGKAALGPVLREVLIGEAMHALGIPTTRALGAVTTGESIWRDGRLPGAVLARVASSHLRVGTFQFFYARNETARLRTLADYAIARHDPDLRGQSDRYLAFFHRVIARQMSLVAQWMGVGFVHGVMNTDNMTISGETIDYGPCAFMDSYDPATVFSSIDHQGRYAYGSQPLLARWNLARLGESLLPLMADDPKEALPDVQSAIEAAEQTYASERRKVFGPKLGVVDPSDDLIDGFLEGLQTAELDFTTAFRQLTDAASGVETELTQNKHLSAWLSRWRKHLMPTSAALMAQANPIYIPRNHIVEEALEAAYNADLSKFEMLLGALKSPFERHAQYTQLESSAPAGNYVTYCGT